MSTKHEVAVELAGGKRLVFETGRMAKQASGAALVTTGAVSYTHLDVYKRQARPFMVPVTCSASVLRGILICVGS